MQKVRGGSMNGGRNIYAFWLEHSFIVAATNFWRLISTTTWPASGHPLRLRSLAVDRTAKAIGHRLNYADQGGCGHFDAAGDTATHILHSLAYE